MIPLHSYSGLRICAIYRHASVFYGPPQHNVLCSAAGCCNLSASPLPLRNHLVTSHATSCGQRRWEPVYNHRHDRGADCYPERKSGTLLESNHYDRSSMDPVVPNFTNFLSCFFRTISFLFSFFVTSELALLLFTFVLRSFPV